MSTKINIILISLVLSILSFSLQAAEVSLNNIETRTAPGHKAQILLEFSGKPPIVNGFAMDSPSKIIFDLDNVDNDLTLKLLKQKVSLGVMTGYNVVSAGDTTRLIVDVLNVVPYHIESELNRIVITLDNDSKAKADAVVNDNYTIDKIDFRRGELGEGKVIIDFADDLVPVDFNENSQEIIVEFRGASISDKLLRKYDVRDFGTNINKISLERKGENVLMRIHTEGTFDRVAYQMGSQYIVEVRPLSATEFSALKSQKFQFTGEKISLNFQDIPIRAVLQLIADFTNINVVISDTVQGNVTLRLENIPWDQSLDFILKSKGLAKRESGDVMLIAPSEELAAREQLELEALQQVQSLEELQTEYIQVNFAQSSALVSIINDGTNNLLSARGQISEDSRTNTLLVKDIPINILNIRELIEKLDVPVRQVIIETQIVETANTLSDALGIKLTGAATPNLGKYRLGMAPTMDQAIAFAQSPDSKTASSDNLFFDFAGVGALAQMGLSLAKLPGGTLLDLELSGSETEGLSKILARPKLMTLDQQAASIETGEEIPYTTVSETGATPTTTFKKAVLKLDVTPHITPNDKISLDLRVNNDTPGAVYNGEVAINTTALNTSVLVDNGQTIVLGGIYKLSTNNSKNYIPYLHKIPLIGLLFGNSSKNTTRTEILIFVTPRIVQNLLSAD